MSYRHTNQCTLFLHYTVINSYSVFLVENPDEVLCWQNLLAVCGEFCPSHARKVYILKNRLIVKAENKFK